MENEQEHEVAETIRSQQQWESHHLEAKSAQALAAVVAEEGPAGWELASVALDPTSSQWHAFLKRPKAWEE